MERLVTQDDLNKYPQLKGMGVSVNQHYDFSYLEGNSIPPSAHIPLPSIAQMNTKFRQPEIRTVIPEKQVIGKDEKTVAHNKPKVKERAPKAIAPKKQEVVKVKKTAPKKIIPIKPAPKKTTKGKKK